MLSEDHGRAHLDLDAAADALVVAPPMMARLRLFDLRRQLLAHMKTEERHLLPELSAEVAAAIGKDHDDLRARLTRAEEAALDAAVGALPRGRFQDELTRLFALMEHHDLRESEAYAHLDVEVEWPPPSVPTHALPRETEIAVARYAWWHQVRGEPPSDWQPTLPPGFGPDDALGAVTLRETELLRTWLACPPGRERLAAAHRLTASLQATVGFTLRRYCKGPPS